MLLLAWHAAVFPRAVWMSVCVAAGNRRVEENAMWRLHRAQLKGTLALAAKFAYHAYNAATDHMTLG